MRVLFVSSGNSGKISILVENQGESLQKQSIDIGYYIIQGKGFWGYFKNIPKIRKYFKKGKFDLVHVHYSFSAFAASLAGRFPIVVSLMGSDAYHGQFFKLFTKLFYHFLWSKTIVKTQQMKEILNLPDALIIPNGVEIDRFKPITKELSRSHINFPTEKKLVLFVSNPNRPEKNFALAQQVISDLNNSDLVLMPVYNIENTELPYYYNAADVLLLTSKWEGSVNVVKEAMACNCPIVTTNVGDVYWVIGNTDGCYVASFEPRDLAEKLLLALKYSRENGSTNGRQQIIDLGLDSESVAKKLIDIYKNTMN